ncbi:hypothetical protein KDA23_00040 [Candidatus Saccharibacteria bacterium]|nr:hypothetical protein [Candidatus Saccharibacteria bacterium]
MSEPVWNIGVCECDYITVTSVPPLVPTGFPNGWIKETRFGLHDYIGKVREYCQGSMAMGSSPTQYRQEIISVTGGLAEEWVKALAARCGMIDSAVRGDGVNGRSAIYRATRIDIKMDVEEPERLDAAKLREVLKSKRWGHRMPSMTVYSSDTDTLYIGSAGSSVRWRVYQKADGIVRYELQLRNGRAMDAALAWRHIASGGDMRDVFMSYARSVSFDDIFQDCDCVYSRPKPDREHKTLEWLNRSVIPALLKLNPGIAFDWLEVAYSAVEKGYERRLENEEI